MKILTALQLQAKNLGACYGPKSWAATTNQSELISYNPTNGAEIASVYNCSDTDYEDVILAAQKSFQTWRLMPAPKRGEIVRLIGDALRTHKIMLAQLVSLEMGKSIQEGQGEVQEMIDMADLAVGQARMLYGNTLHSERPLHRMYEQWHPLGVVGVMTAFNFPVAVWAWNAFLAAIGGNTIVWKPSPKTPLCALAVQHICNDVMAANNLSGVFTLFITSDNDLAAKFVNDPRVALISFTGSTNIGRMINKMISQRLGRVLLELSGNNAIILADDADLKLAIPAIVFGAIGTAGQRCTSTRRLFIHEKIYDRVITALCKAYEKITIGDPLDEKILMGPLIDAEAVAQFQQAILANKNLGGEILFGGDIVNRAGFFVQPTLIAAENHWPIVQNETFAPILYVMKFNNLAAAIEMQNAVPQGLSSAIFTTSLTNAEQFLAASGSDCGIANVNIGTSGAEIGGAFGGEKDTGGGREAGSDAWKAYMRRQTNTINWGQTIALAQGIKFDV
jgi:aldehyde dehydrogenase (NAD+)